MKLPPEIQSIPVFQQVAQTTDHIDVKVYDSEARSNRVQYRRSPRNRIRLRARRLLPCGNFMNFFTMGAVTKDAVQ